MREYAYDRLGKKRDKYDIIYIQNSKEQNQKFRQGNPKNRFQSIERLAFIISYQYKAQRKKYTKFIIEYRAWSIKHGAWSMEHGA
jgi:hypothetical protein